MSLNGSEFPDEWVIRGNHHDAWVNGAEDPISGMVAELEEKNHNLQRQYDICDKK